MIIDLSSNNPHPINYVAAKAGGVQAAIIKATDGTGYTNPYFAIDVAGFTAVGVPTLGYHFAEFTSEPAEAAHFRAVAGNRARVLDSETNTDAAWQNAFLLALGLPGYEELDYGSASTLPRTGIRSLLWPASYGRNYGFGDCWQYTDAATVSGIGGLVDASVWIGSQADFDSLFMVTGPPPPPTTTEVPKMMASTPKGNGYWQLKPDGSVWSFGDAVYHGGCNPGAPERTNVPGQSDTQGPAGGLIPTGRRAISLTAYPIQGLDGEMGYWVEDDQYHVFSFGLAAYHGAAPNP